MQEVKDKITILPLTIDGIFKIYFEDPRNLPELRDFLFTHIELEADDLESITVLNPGLPKDNISDKGFTVDLLLKTKSENDIHLEMQTNPHLNFKERVQLYNARKAGSQLKIGEEYNQTKRTVSLIITDFQVFDDANDYQESIFMCRKNGKLFTNVQEIHIIDLTKINSVASNERQKYLWGKLLKTETTEALEMLAKESEIMAKATQKLIQISADERVQAYAMSRENSEFARRIHEHGLMEQGIEQGEHKKTIEIARKLIKKGTSISDISEITGLSEQETKQLMKECR